MWNQGLQWAIAVAQQVEKLLPAYLTEHQLYNNASDMIVCDDWYHIQSYQNGREQGISIWISSLKGKTFGTFYICKSRKEGFGFYFGRQALQGLSQEAYENGFTYVEDSVECAKIIANKIKESL